MPPKAKPPTIAVDDAPTTFGALTLNRSTWNGPLGRVHHDLTLTVEDGKTVDDYTDVIASAAAQLGCDVDNLTIDTA